MTWRILDYIGRGIMALAWLAVLAVACALAPLAWLVQWLCSHRR